MAEYTVVNLVTLVIGLGLLFNGYYIVRRGREDIALFVLSAIVGLGLVFVALLPNAFQSVATVLGLELQARAILVVSNLVLFVVVTYLFNRIGKLYDQQSRLNEEVSLLKNDLEEHRDDR
ncbi:DUF2304 domain-containing protein [Halomarina rubra]|uniref:DUF2304 domain-containing protein n=1 Tax=Halomarina rubra TaxID=2071873 RepID=A0ABD6AQR4_9EURY|nr:DUF2304 domain-containing protein [Halomarina rubra]